MAVLQEVNETSHEVIEEASTNSWKLGMRNYQLNQSIF